MSSNVALSVEDGIALGEAALDALAEAGMTILAAYVDVTQQPNGIVEMEGSLPSDEAELVHRALAAFMDPPAKGDRRTRDQRQHDALITMSQRALAARERYRPGPRAKAS
ncbi:MAG: DUF222 domain-containing protein [Streptosporangiales bacterium]|nr:DUF222 domain-containing protein [Streptosporangiales bacterium]